MVDLKKLNADDLSENARELLKTIGAETFCKLSHQYGGEYLYIPKMDRLERSIRNQKILEEFTGYNHKELARKYGISTIQIRTIVKKQGE